MADELCTVSSIPCVLGGHHVDRGAASSSSSVPLHLLGGHHVDLGVVSPQLELNAIDGVVRRSGQVIPETHRSQRRLVEQRNQPGAHDKHGPEHPDPTHNQATGPNTPVDKHPLDGNTARINVRHKQHGSPKPASLTHTCVKQKEGPNQTGQTTRDCNDPRSEQTDPKGQRATHTWNNETPVPTTCSGCGGDRKGGYTR